MASFNARVSNALRSFGNARKNWGILTGEAVDHFVKSGDAGYLSTMLQQLESEKGTGLQVGRWKGYVAKATNVKACTLKDGKIGYKRAAQFNGEVVEGRVVDTDTLAGDWWTFGNADKDTPAQDISALKKYLENKLKDDANVTDSLRDMAGQILESFFEEEEESAVAA